MTRPSKPPFKDVDEARDDRVGANKAHTVHEATEANATCG
jgi:hypothetical protein